ncbi:hypothetical protein FB45DRAFT_876930 [Roridomyces roridus]|uniref:F-box domain-containing protein n=1 Tax=Roridomyces roridus TaxID=1738132 RepID=A0AAD7FB89_9AGAR|nr:hypothetical protein FB45DRAFT_876930 [Roridomyces roridus]
MARTCRTFSEPALDVLWGSARLTNLLCCLPADVWKSTPRGLKLLRTIESSDLERMRFYAPRIKHLIGEESINHRAFFPIFGTVDLFCNVQTLQWSRAGDDFNNFHRLLRSKLKTLSLEFRYFDRNEVLWPALNVHHSELKDVHILLKNAPFGDEDFTGVYKFLHCLQGIENLTIPGLDSERLHHLASLPTLSSLVIGRNFPKEIPDRRGTETQFFVICLSSPQ